MRRRKGKCPTCGRILAVKIGVGPYADGRGDVMEHRSGTIKKVDVRPWCLGGKALDVEAR